MKETIIFESRVNIKKIKGDIQLTLTSTDIVLKKEKGLFKKEWKTIKEINLNDVVTNNNKLKIIETDVFIKTNKEEIVICFNDKKKARIFADKVVDTKIGENKFARGMKNAGKLAKAGIKVVGSFDSLIPDDSKVKPIFSVAKIFKDIDK